MNLTRLRVSEDADRALISLKARTGLTPNLLCRIGFCLSLNMPTIPKLDDYGQDSNRELNRYTLTGEWDTFFIALLKERCAKDHLDLENDLESQFKAHINRGVIELQRRVKHLSDINRIIQENNFSFRQRN